MFSPGDEVVIRAGSWYRRQNSQGGSYHDESFNTHRENPT